MLKFGNKIRELRQKKGLTCQQIATVLKVTSQDVLDWEMGYSYPNTALIPSLASFFGVSIDIMTGYDMEEVNNKVDAIIKSARPYFFTEPKRYAEIMKDALNTYPANEALLTTMLEVYEYDLSINNCTDHLDDIIEIAEQILAECSDFMKVCDIKEIQAMACRKKGDYDKAKVILETLPDIKKNDAIALHLSGSDKLDGAVQSKNNHLKGLCTACTLEGDAWFQMRELPDGASCNHVCEDNILKAIKCYQKGLAVIELFLIPDGVDKEPCLNDEMQTFHYSFHMKLASCYKKLAQRDECKSEVDKAYQIVLTILDDCDGRRDEIISFFNRYLKENDLVEFIR